MKGGSAPYNNSPEETPEDACSRISSYLAEKYPEASPAEALAALPTAERMEWLNGLSAEEQKVLEYTWLFWARPKQREPKDNYKILILLSGRGAGKTRGSAEIVRGWVESGKKKHIAVVGTTAADVRDTMVEAVYKQGSGIMQICPPWNMPHFSPTKKQIVWTNPNYPSYGAVCSLYSADVPESLRGPSHDAAWVDELCKMRNNEEVWHQLKFTLRSERTVGDGPRIIVSTTPKPIKLLIDLLKEADESRLDGTNDIIVIKGNTYENRANLSADFLKDIADSYEGTSLGRQEIYADLILQADGALWTPGMIEKGRIRFGELPTLKSIVVAVDPQTGYRADSDSPVRKLRMVARSTMTGIVTCGLGMPIKGQPLHAYVLRDDSVNGKPEEWGKRVVDTYNLYAQRYPTIVVAESNQGGLMVESIIRSIDPHVRVRLISSQKKKHERAIPVVAKYQQNRVHHIGYFPQLEQQMCLTGDTTVITRDGPRRLDSMVGESVNVLGGDGEWHSATGHYYGEQDVSKINISRRKHKEALYATADHRWFANRSRNRRKYKFNPSNTREMRTHELCTDDLLIGRTRRSLLSHIELDQVGVMAGFVYGDGWGRDTDCGTAFFEHDVDIIPWFGKYGENLHPTKTLNGGICNRIYGLPRFMNRNPDYRESSRYLYGWLAGYLAADGCVSDAGQVTIASVDRYRLEIVRHVCCLLGIQTNPILRIETSIEPRPVYHRETGEIVHRIRSSSECFTIGLDPGSLRSEFFIHERHRKRWEEDRARPSRINYLNWVVESVEPAGKRDVYCLTVPDDGRFVLAETHIISGNCFYEPGDEDEKLSPDRMDSLVHGIRYLLVDGIRAGAGISISRRI